MQQWDYRIVYRGEKTEEWVMDGKPAPELGKADDPEVLKRLGKEGWELVSVVGYTYFFKKPA